MWVIVLIEPTGVSLFGTYSFYEDAFADGAVHLSGQNWSISRLDNLPS